MMPKFYDPIELEDIDISDSRVKFYILSIDTDLYKVCATIYDLDSPEMQGGDPETRIANYWPITREQMNAADLGRLFPNDTLRSSPINFLQMLNIFHFDPTNAPQKEFGKSITFNDETFTEHLVEDAPEKNGQPIAWDTQLSRDDEDYLYWTLIILEHMIQQGVLVNRNWVIQQYWTANAASFFLEAVRANDIPLDILKSLDALAIAFIILHYESLQNFRVLEMVGLISGFYEYQAYKTSTMPEDIISAQENCFIKHFDNIASVFLHGITDRHFSNTDLYEAIFYHSKLEPLSEENFTIRVNALKTLMPAILNQEINFKDLIGLSTNKLKMLSLKLQDGAEETPNFERNTKRRI